MNLYRVKYGIENGGASWGDWRYYEKEDKMLIDLLEAYLDMEAKEAKVKRNWLRMMLGGIWSKHVKGNDETFSRYSNVFAVEKVVNDEWVPVEVEFIKPEVRLKP